MMFESASPSIVRSVKQRDLLNTWLRLRSTISARPSISEYNPVRIEDEIKDIVHYVVKRNEFSWQFIIDSNGSRLSQAYGTTDRNNIGTDLRDYVGPQMVDLVLPIYEECANRELPTYSASTIKDINGRTVVYERLLLPFFDRGAVSHIIASLKTISEDGKFEINNLLRDPHRLPQYKIRAVIDQDLVVCQTAIARATRTSALPATGTSDVIEI
ncbi:hypothetical protein [Bradyrhizobium sp. LHD-71]|uniref:hypothetical protein n=1 Tax=Bradyrhizobium sp. LHD-71 TaxID=3072141 RepID=UPI002810007A|nr:hypothetical protein [Bradyrhizobium sp. LHD-71]MDQ8729841.1 hypothetical protein [Bradyrhizobium sp. LHD-71]